jgi:hypothetical protein
MLTALLLLAIAAVGVAWRATTVAGLANASMAVLVVAPMVIAAGAARDDWRVAVVVGAAFAGGYALAAARDREAAVRQRRETVIS